MRRVGWVLFAATGVLVVVQGVLIALSPYDLLSYEVFVDGTFPLVPIGALLGSAVGSPETPATGSGGCSAWVSSATPSG